MYHGVIVPLVTPLSERGAVCEESVRALVGGLHGKVSAFMPALSSGEGSRLDETQWYDMISLTRRYARGAPVLAGIQRSETRQIIELGRIAERLSVDAVVVSTPVRRDISQREIREHFEVLRGALRVPLFIYNESALSGNHVDVESLIDVCRRGGVVGVKESSGSTAFLRQLLAADTGVPVFQGWEHLCRESQGVHGYVLPLANLDPALCNEMFEAPSREKQAAIDAACARHGLLRDDWYSGIKRELRARGVIKTERVATS
ncbi:dihydrodipicolinate synthase family protein [Sorangium sp. So ce1128]